MQVFCYGLENSLFIILQKANEMFLNEANKVCFNWLHKHAVGSSATRVCIFNAAPSFHLHI